MSQMGQSEPPSFVAGTAELASIADAGEARQPTTVRPRPPGDGCSPETGRRAGRPSSRLWAKGGLVQRNVGNVGLLLLIQRYASFANGFVVSRRQSMKSCATGLSVRPFSVTMLTIKGIGISTGKTFNESLAGLK